MRGTDGYWCDVMFIVVTGLMIRVGCLNPKFDDMCPGVI